MKKDLLASLSLFLVAVIWGTGFIASQMALDAQLSSAFIIFVRFAIAALLVGLIFHKDLKRQLKREHLKGGILIGSFLFFAFYVQTVGLQYTTPSNNAFITAANVVIVPFLWWAVSHKKPGNKYIFASFLCLMGIGILSFKGGALSFQIGDLLTLLCAFLFACQIVATGILAAQMEAKVIVFLQFVVAAAWGLVMFLLTDRDFSAFVNSEGMSAVVYLGVFSTCLCYFLQTSAQRFVHSTKAAIILATESLFGSIFSVLLGYDPMSAQLVVGGLIILTSIILPELPIGKKEEPVLVEKKEEE